MTCFSATIYKLGINPVVDPPDHALKAIFGEAARSKGAIAVRGLINGAEYIQTLVKYRGVWRLYVNGGMLKNSGLRVGDTAIIEISFDPVPRSEPMPPELDEALSQNKKARAAFDALTPSRRKEILRYLGFLRSKESLNRNIEKVISNLSGEKSAEPPIFMAARKK